MIYKSILKREIMVGFVIYCVLRPNFFRSFKLAQARWLFAMRAKKTSKPELEEGLEKLS